MRKGGRLSGCPFYLLGPATASSGLQSLRDFALGEHECLDLKHSTCTCERNVDCEKTGVKFLTTAGYT
jgi:hypothetical protein